MALRCIGGGCKKTTRSAFVWGSQGSFLDFRIKWCLSHLIFDLYKVGPHSSAQRQHLGAGGGGETDWFGTQLIWHVRCSLHDGLTCALMMTVPWQMMKITISGNWFRCPDFLSTRLSPLEMRLPFFCPQSQPQIPSSNLKFLPWISVF